MIIVDEAHHAAAKTYRKILEHSNGSWLIGLTATPARTDGEGLKDLFEVIVHGPELEDLIEQGYLSPYRIIAPTSRLDLSRVHIKRGDYVTEEVEAIIDQSTVIGDAVEHYRKYIAPKTCLVYCVSRRHARHVADYYQQAGHDAVYVAGDTSKTERDQAVAGFRNGSPAIIVSVDLFGEGLDVPGLAAVQLLRPTQSLILHLQQIGRSLRIEKGKQHAVVLDHVGNTWRHGLPDDAREWTLEGQKKRKRNEGEAEIHLRHCPNCLCIYPARLPACPQCGAEAVTQGRVPDHKDGELREIEKEEHRRLRQHQRYQQGRARTLEELVEVALAQGKKPGYAAAVFAARLGKPRWTYINQAREIAARKAG
jgi:DNA repair protein RadD